MSICELLSRCKFMKEGFDGDHKTRDRYKRSYCRGDNTHCARYMVYISCGSGAVPGDLQPYQSEKARIIIKELKRSSKPVQTAVLAGADPGEHD